MATEYKNLQMEIIIKDNIKKGSFMVRASTHGQMVHHTRVILLKDIVMAKAIGNHLEEMVIFILVGTKMIKNMDMVDMYG